MKNKVLLIALASVVVLAAGYFAYWWFRPGIVIEEVLPQGPVAYVRLAHGAELWDGFLNSAFYKNLSAIDVEKVLKRNKVGSKDIREYRRVRQLWVQLNDNPWIKRVLGKEVVIALYPDKVKGVYPLVIIRLDHTLQTAQIAAQLLKPVNEDVEVSTQQMEGQTVYALTMKKYKQKLYYVRWQDVLVIAQDDPRFLRGVLARFQGKGIALSHDSHWRFAKDNAYAASDADAFINPFALLKVFNPDIAAAKDATWDHVKDFRTFAVSFNHAQESRFKFSVDVDDKAQPCPPADNKSMALVPANVIAYNWGNCYDFSSYWHSLKEALVGYPVFAEWLDHYTNAVKRRLGVDIEKDLLPLVGSEVGGYLTEIDTKALFPYPRLLVFIKLNNASKTTGLLSTMKDKLPVDLAQEKYEGRDITYLNLPVGSNTDPGYSVVGDYLLLATSRQLLKKSIDTAAVPARSLAEDKSVKDLGLADITDANAVALLRTSAIVKRAKILSDWADKFFASQVSTALVYHKEWEARKGDFDSMIDDKKQEVKAAQERLAQIQDQDPLVVANQQHVIQTDIERLKAEMEEIKSKKIDGALQVKDYEKQAESAKLTMFNNANVLMPVLNALETIEAQSVKFHVTSRLMQTELVIK